MSRLGPSYREFEEALEAVGPPPRAVALPPPAERPELLGRLRIARDDAAELIAAWPSPADGDLWWILERAHHLLLRDLGGFRYLGWPDLPSSFGDAGRYFWVYVFLATLGDLRRWHDARGIPREIADVTLADLGRNLARDRRLFGKGGLRTHDWLTLHFRGAIYELGRLQFNRMELRPVHETLELGRAPLRAGDSALGIHIPEAGPLTPEACDASLNRAREFFARHFPETPARFAMCTSWLLDPQLAEYLDPDSNIIRFQRRFQLLGGYEGDADILRFVFGRIAPVDIATLPRRTTLERAIVDHLNAGRHWQNRTGWLEL